MAIGPRLANWPKDNSMKKRGMPTTASMMMKGSRKAPVKSVMKLFRIVACCAIGFKGVLVQLSTF